MLDYYTWTLLRGVILRHYIYQSWGNNVYEHILHFGQITDTKWTNSENYRTFIIL